MPSFIPLELIEVILAHLHDDKPTLRACALVGRSWVHASQQHIFDHVSLNSQDLLDALSLLLENCPHLRPLVRSLSWFPEPDIGHHEFPLAALFPRLHTLFYMGKQLNCAFVLGLSSLKKLELGRFMHLSDVEVYTDTEGVLRQSCPWSELVMEEVQMPVMDWLTSAMDFPHLRILELPLPDEDEVHAVLVRFLGYLEVLQELKLIIDSHLIATPLNLGVMGIVTLHLDVYADDETVPLIFGLSRKTSFPRLRHLRLDLGPSYESHTTFDPMAIRNGSSHLVREWALEPSLAAQLESISITMRAIDVLKRARDFFALFGEANRPEILRVRPESVRLLD